jgi:hypothetical protein
MRTAWTTMSDDIATNYAELERKYRELADALRMIRRAVDRAVGAGVLPSIGRSPLRRVTPLQECDTIARTIYAAAGKQQNRSGRDEMAGLDHDQPKG